MRSNGYDSCDTSTMEARFFPSANIELTCQLANERKELSDKIDTLIRVIKLNPSCVNEHHKDLWRKQAKAMKEYADILGERIKDLIDLGAQYSAEI